MRILIADDHPLFRVGLRAMLEREGFQVVAEAENGEEAVALTLKKNPEAALLDVKMPVMDGLEAAKRLREAGYKGFIVMLTTFTEPALQVAAARSGANAYLSKEASPLEVAQTLRGLASGRLKSFTPPEVPELTTRERQVLSHLAQGLSAKQIAKELSLSPETVRDHIKRLYQKLEAGSRIEALANARNLGLL